MDAAPIVQALGNWSSRRGPLHQRLSSAFIEAIRQGLLPAGARVAAERTLAGALAISRTTVVSAYNTLRAEGWLESRPGSGTRVRAQRARLALEQTHADTLGRSSLLNLLLVDGDVIDLALGTPLPLAELEEPMFSISSEIRKQFLMERNFMPLGLPELRQAIAGVFAQQGLPTSADQILVTSGAQQAISLAVSLFLHRGDTVLLENPTYFGALEALRLAGARLAALEAGPRHVEPQALHDQLAAHRPRLIYLGPTHHNPTGVTMPDVSRRAIARIVDACGTPLIEDNTLGELNLDGSAPRLIAAYATSGNVLTIGSLSKLYWSGLRIGWIRGPAAVIQQFARIKSTSDLGVPLVTQAIAAQLIAVIDKARALRRSQLTARRDLVASMLRERLPEWEFALPSGGLFLWVRIPGTDVRQFAQFAARCQVSLTPGALFSVNGTHTEFLRIPFLLDEQALEAGIVRLQAAWEDFRRLPSARVFSPIAAASAARSTFGQSGS